MSLEATTHTIHIRGTILSTRHTALCWLLVANLWLATSACDLVPKLNDASFSCDADRPCEAGFTCAEGVCVPAGTVPEVKDQDDDSVADEADNCPAVANTDQEDSDADGQGDACDEDDDDDGRLDTGDNCPLVSNFDQADNDGDGEGDACDADDDNDDVADASDNCPMHANTDQNDTDGDEEGDSCDEDDDADGRLDGADNCPLEPETVNDFEDVDGCPDQVGDADGDGIIDTADACPADAEDADGHEDEDGCPDPDNDGDGVLDEADRCVNEPGPVPNHGCPDADRDGDTVVDRLDNCPDEPGPVDNRGCQEEQQVVIQDGELEVLDMVYFRTNSARIRSRSYALLMNVARVINAHPEIQSVDVIGHTDARGDAQRNLTLSRARAASVVEFLVERGDVEASRLQSHGYGQERPVVPNATTLEEHAQNRRVEFKLDSGTD